MKKAFVFGACFLLIIFISISCNKKDDVKPSKNNLKEATSTNNFAKGTSGVTYPSGNSGNNFISGSSGNSFATGTTGSSFTGQPNNNDDASCLLGSWIQESTQCSEGYHLKLTFESNGSGNAVHLDEFLCVVNMRKHFTWTLRSGVLKIHYIDIDTGSEDDSETYFSCPANLLHIKWNGGNDKYLTKE